MLTIRYSGRDPRVDPIGSEDHYYQGADIDRCLRFGLEYADGIRITNVDRVAGVLEHRPEDSPRLVHLSGGGGGDEQSKAFVYRWWVNGLPPAGPVIFAIEWPAAAIPFTRFELVDSAEVSAAGSNQPKLWSG